MKLVVNARVVVVFLKASLLLPLLSCQPVTAAY